MSSDRFGNIVKSLQEMLKEAEADVKESHARLKSIRSALRAFGKKKLAAKIPTEMARKMTPAGRRKMSAIMKKRHALARKAGFPSYIAQQKAAKAAAGESE